MQTRQPRADQFGDVAAAKERHSRSEGAAISTSGLQHLHQLQHILRDCIRLQTLVKNVHRIHAAGKLYSKLLNGWKGMRLERLGRLKHIFLKSRNNLEEGLLRRLKTLLPEGLRVIVLADRGFGRTELGRLSQELGFSYVIRISADVWVRSPRFPGKLLDSREERHRPRAAERGVPQERSADQNVVTRWKPGLPKKRDECWFLMTDLDQSAVRLSDLYGQRMTVEELFRDDKNRRNGWALRNTQLTQADWIDRLLLILALAYILLCGLGLVARQRYDPSAWCSNSRPHTCSIFTIGRILADPPWLSAAHALTAVINALANAPPNWG